MLHLLQIQADYDISHVLRGAQVKRCSSYQLISKCYIPTMSSCDVDGDNKVTEITGRLFKITLTAGISLKRRR